MTDGLQLARDKMTAAGVNAQAIEVFSHYYAQLQQGVTGFIAEDSITPLEHPDLLPRPRVSVDDYASEPIAAIDRIEGHPVARAHQVLHGPAGLRGGFWDCTSGRFRWFYGVDEVIYVLEGEAHLTAPDGTSHRIGAGEMFHFVQGTEWIWHVPTYIHKAFFLRTRPRSPIARVRRKLVVLRRRRALGG